MSSGAITAARGYRVTGIAALAVRVGRAIEGWGYRVARPVDGGEVERKREAQRLAESRRRALEADAARRQYYINR